MANQGWPALRVRQVVSGAGLLARKLGLRGGSREGHVAGDQHLALRDSSVYITAVDGSFFPAPQLSH